MKKILILIVSLIGTLAITGCKQSVGVNRFGCEGSDARLQCEGSVAYRATWKSTNPGFDASLAKIDFTDSNVNLTAKSGTILLTIKNSNGSIIASSVFDWYSVGNFIHPSNAEAMSNWVNSYLQNNYEIVFDISGIQTDGQYGNNTLTAIFDYDGSTIGASRSYYLNAADLNGF